MLIVQNRGQILLVVVLSMIVALTVGLSIAARIVTELKLSKQNEESQRAFQAAESGIQQTLQLRSNIPNINLDNNSSYSTEFDADGGSAIVLNNGQVVDQATGADVWLSDYPNFANPISGAINVYWGSPNQTSCVTSGGESIIPALEVVALTGSVASPTIVRNVFEATTCGSTRISNAELGTTNGGGTWELLGVQFQYRATLRFAGGSNISQGLIMKVIPIFNSGVVGFQASGGTVFPAQGSIVNSTGSSGDTVRKVEYYQSYPQLPLEVFPYSLISQ